MRTQFTFRSLAFNTPQSRAEYINPGNYGDDLARWLMRRLRSTGVSVEEGPGQEDHGWYLSFTAAGLPHTVIVGHREGDDSYPSDWVGWVERDASFLVSLFGGRRRGIAPEAVQAVHRALSAAPEVEKLTWHEAADFNAGREELGSPQP